MDETYCSGDCRIRSLIRSVLALGIVGLLAAAGIAAKPPSDKGDQVVSGGDLVFMNDAAPGGMAEVELGRMAVEHGASGEVKKFGKKMVAEHSKAGGKLKELAGEKHVMLPAELTPKQKESVEKLSKLSGAEFDRAYVAAMVEAHLKDVAAFENIAQNGVDADVKAFAAKTLPVLKMHLQMIEALADKMRIKPE